jgi:SagB-type dehydrogenase family enzyme
MDYKETIKERRRLLKAQDSEEVPDEWWETDQRKGVAAPPLEKPHDPDAEVLDLVDPKDFTVGRLPLIEAIAARKSHRAFTGEPLSLEELSFLLWATQGVREVDKNRVWTKRVTPSGGGRQPIETYLLVRDVSGLKEGVYRYLPIEHKLLLVTKTLPSAEDLLHYAWAQDFIGKAPLVFVWTAIPYKTEWRYSIISYKDILIEAGHVCQNLYLACGAIGAGTCAIAAYSQEAMDSLLQVDGEDEMTVYLSPVGKVTKNGGD